MGKVLLIEALVDSQRREVGRVQSGEVFIGREPGEGGITIENTAVSRQHGSFSRFRSHWFYKDLGSTNGSWVNGTRLTEGQWRLVRPGDVLQFADGLFRISEVYDGVGPRQAVSGFPNLRGRSLLVFSKGEFLDEYPVPEYGRALVIGGSDPDLELEGDLFELPSLVIERRGDQIVGFSLAKEVPIYLDGIQVAEHISLKDGSEVRISNYAILYNDPAAAAQQLEAAEREAAIAAGSTTEIPSVGSQAGQAHATQALKAPPKKSLFGQASDTDFDETFALDMTEAGGAMGREIHPALRSALSGRGNRSQEDQHFASLEDKIILGVGFLLLAVLMVLVIWWVLS